MKKILILNPYLPTLGGGEKHMGYLCQFMEEYYKYDLKIDILVHNYNEENIYSRDYVTIEKVNQQFGLHLKKTYLRKENFEKKPKKMSMDNYISQITKEYDIFINFMIFSRHIGRAKINLYQCMFPPKTYMMERKKGFLPYLYAQKADFCFRHSYDCFISNSAYTNHWFYTFWKEKNKNRVIYPPVFKQSELAGRYQEENKKNIIISVGRFFVASHSKKQLDMVRFFVSHYEAFQNYEYHLVGAISTYPDDIAYLEEIKRIGGTVNNVFVHENYPYEKLKDLYQKAKIFWHATGYGVDENVEPEKMEHFGITTVEAMSFGAVPVVINKGGQKETVEEGINGFRWDTEEECVEKTLRLTQNDTLRKKMAEASVEKAKMYSIEAFYERNRQVFHELHI